MMDRIPAVQMKGSLLQQTTPRAAAGSNSSQTVAHAPVPFGETGTGDAKHCLQGFGFRV